MRTIAETIADAPTVHMGATLGQAARSLRAADADVVVVLGADEQPVGIVTERELVEAVAASRHPDHGTVDSWMRTDVFAVAAPAEPKARRARPLPATDAGALVGRRERARTR